MNIELVGHSVLLSVHTALRSCFEYFLEKRTYYERSVVSSTRVECNFFSSDNLLFNTVTHVIRIFWAYGKGLSIKLVTTYLQFSIHISGTRSLCKTICLSLFKRSST